MYTRFLNVRFRSIVPPAAIGPDRARAMTTSNPLLTLVLSSRNDSYQGNSLWRLNTALNFIGREAAASGVPVEIIVTDWGSDTPLRSALTLSSEAARTTLFLEVPPELARTLQGDSAFPEVIANNAAIRRAAGEYIGRIDQDTLVTRQFLRYWAEQAAADGNSGWRSAVHFTGRRSIPRGFTAGSPPIQEVIAYVGRCGRLLPPEGRGRRPWFDAPVGILLMHRRLWHELSGYDERLLYWGYMETELLQRAGARFPIIDLERVRACRFFHLGHSPRRIAVTGRRKNLRRTPEQRPAAADWGLACHEFAMCRAEPAVSSGESRELMAPGAASPMHLLSILKEWWIESLLYLPRVAANLVRFRSDGAVRQKTAKRGSFL